MKVRMFYGARLREARKAKGISQSQLASRIEAHVTSISDWERGANAPSGRHVSSLARELDVGAGYFYGDDDEPFVPSFANDLAAMLERVIESAVERRMKVSV